jgi:hypothetical protein
MNQTEAKKYKDYPEGSGGKKIYDTFYLPFQDYLKKYYSNPDLSRWNYINSKFITPLFDGTKWEDYMRNLQKIKPNFLPSQIKVKEFSLQIKNDIRFSNDLKHFFSFLYSIDFFRELTFEEWLNAKNWKHPWHMSETGKSILELKEYPFSENYIKEQLSQLSIF